MNVRINCFPGGRNKALTMSYDDGRIHDRRLVEIFNKYGIRGTFHLNSGFLGFDGYVKAEEIADLYKGHEVSVHTVHHPHPGILPKEMLVEEIMDDRKNLEKLVKYPVRGMSYPFGTFNEAVVQALPMMGIEYSRTVISHRHFGLPENFLKWPATCHHNDDIAGLGKKFLEHQSWGAPSLFYIWGHSYEFENDNNWEKIEDFCKLIGGRDDIWYATNIEIVDYINAVKNLKFSAAVNIVYNPSAIPVWISVDSKPVEVAPGMTLNL